MAVVIERLWRRAPTPMPRFQRRSWRERTHIAQERAHAATMAARRAQLDAERMAETLRWVHSVVNSASYPNVVKRVRETLEETGYVGSRP